jgi:hypothetical protein
MFAWRWAIEVMFRASKQVMDIEAPQQRSQEALEKLAPWVWSMPSVVMVWYITAGQGLPEAEELRGRMGEWDREWSLRPMIQVMRRAILTDRCANKVKLFVSATFAMLKSRNCWFVAEESGFFRLSDKDIS